MVNAVVGVIGVPTPINDLVRPCFLNVVILGVESVGNGTIPFLAPPTAGVVVNITADGVRVVRVGEGGKTKRVWWGVADVKTVEDSGALDFRSRWSGGGTGLRDSVRCRRPGFGRDAGWWGNGSR